MDVNYKMLTAKLSPIIRPDLSMQHRHRISNKIRVITELETITWRNKLSGKQSRHVSPNRMNM